MIKRLLLSLLLMTSMMSVQAALEKGSDGFYSVASLQDWKDFAALVATEPTANVKMTADIDLGNDQTMIGTSDVPFQGIFDGGGHTLTVAYNTEEAIVAPFRYVKDVVIANLHVAGSIYSGDYGVGGIIGTSLDSSKSYTYGIVMQCVVSALLSANPENTSENNNTIGGIVAIAIDDIVISDCVFRGTIATNRNNGGLIAKSVNDAYLRNSLVAGTYNTGAVTCNTFGSGVAFIDHCFYLLPYGTDETNGRQVSAEELGDGTALSYLQEPLYGAMSEWEQKDGMPQPKMNASVKGIFINETNFPDAVFRNRLLQEEYGEDGYIDFREQLNDASYIDVSYYYSLKAKEGNMQKAPKKMGSEEYPVITDAKGIELFRYVNYFECYSNAIEQLDLSQNRTMQFIDVSSNKLTELIVSDKSYMNYIDCSMNQLKGEAVDKLIESLPDLSNLSPGIFYKMKHSGKQAKFLAKKGIRHKMTAEGDELPGRLIAYRETYFYGPTPVGVDPSEYMDGNRFTAEQVEAAAAKGWNVYAEIYDGYIDYEGYADKYPLTIFNTQIIEYEEYKAPRKKEPASEGEGDSYTLPMYINVTSANYDKLTEMLTKGGLLKSGTITFDPELCKLTLDNAQLYDCVFYNFVFGGSFSYYSVPEYAENLTVELIGDNVVLSSRPDPNGFLFLNGNTTFTGKGSLTTDLIMLEAMAPRSYELRAKNKAAKTPLFTIDSSKPLRIKRMAELSEDEAEPEATPPSVAIAVDGPSVNVTGSQDNAEYSIGIIGDECEGNVSIDVNSGSLNVSNAEGSEYSPIMIYSLYEPKVNLGEEVAFTEPAGVQWVTEKIYASAKPGTFAHAKARMKAKAPRKDLSLDDEEEEEEEFYYWVGYLADGEGEMLTGTTVKIVTNTAEGDDLETVGGQIEIEAGDITYNGDEQKPDIVVTANGEELTEGVDFTVTYSDNTDAGTATITVTGIGKYSGSITKTFDINPKKLQLSSVIIECPLTLIYNGNILTPEVIVRPASGDGAFVEGVDYIITWTDRDGNVFKDIVNPDTYYCHITMIGNYEGSFTRTVVIAGTVGITDVNANADAAEKVYNLHGQRVGNSYRGITVRNGRKVVAK